MDTRTQNNKVELSGEIISNFEFSHEVYGEKFYIAMLSIERLSGTKDILPIMVSDRLVDVKVDWIGRFVKVTGQFRSYNLHEEDKSRLILSVFARQFEEIGEIPFINGENYIYLDGYICKKPIYRETPLGRKIVDIMLAVNRQYRRTDYIPCIAWGSGAALADTLEVGTRLRIEGRIQSREYQKKISDDEFETRTAFEVSASRIEVVEEMEEQSYVSSNLQV